MATGSGMLQEMRWWREEEEEEEEEDGRRAEMLRATASFMACSVRGVFDHRCNDCQCAKSATSEGYKVLIRVWGKQLPPTAPLPSSSPPYSPR